MDPRAPGAGLGRHEALGLWGRRERGGVADEALLPQICGTIKWRLNNKSASCACKRPISLSHSRVMRACGEDQLMGHLGVVLYEYLGEEYPEVLGSILGVEGYRKCDRHVEDDAAHQRLALINAHPEESPREGAGELYRAGHGTARDDA